MFITKDMFNIMYELASIDQKILDAEERGLDTPQYLLNQQAELEHKLNKLQAPLQAPVSPSKRSLHT